MRVKLPDPPSADKRWKLVGAAMRRHGYQRHALVEVLHAVQEAYGFLDDDSLRYVAACLRVPLSVVYGVATFYHFFTLKPKGKHTCVVCMGTACYIKGAPAILEAIEKKHGIKVGETTEDGELSLLTARCIGACGVAPAAVMDGEAAGKLTADETLAKIEKGCKCHDA